MTALAPLPAPQLSGLDATALTPRHQAGHRDPVAMAARGPAAPCNAGANRRRVFPHNIDSAGLPDNGFMRGAEPGRFPRHGLISRAGLEASRFIKNPYKSN